MNTESTNKAPAKTMAELMKKQQTSFTPLHRGTQVAGKITKLASSEILMDINYKTDAIVIEKERRLLKNLISLLHVGDTVTATIISPESENGHPVVSLRHYVDDMAWGKLSSLQKKQQRISVVVQETTRGGFIAETEDGIIGFLPNSHVSFKQNQEDITGQEIRVSILELNRESKKIIFSQKSVVSVEDFHKAVSAWKIGQKITAFVSGITPFGVFVLIHKETSTPTSNNEKMDTVDGLIHISEIDWEKTPVNLHSQFSLGKEVTGIITKFDDHAKRVDLSIKRLTADPFEAAAKQVTVDQKVSGTVKNIADMGVTVDLEIDGRTIEGLIRKEKIPPTMKFEIGKKIPVIVSQIDTKKRKILLVPSLVEKPIGYR